MQYLVVVNPIVADKLREYGVTKPKIEYIPNFVDEENFYEQPKEKIALAKAQHNVGENKFTVLGVGQLQTRKGVADFVKVASELPDIQFIWAGGFSFGVITDGYKELTEIVNNAPSNVEFLGIIERDEMINLYNICDLMFLPSFDELFPMSILEAMCCKKPLLLRDIEVYDDILFDCYAKASDVSGFANEIKKLSSDETYYEDYKQKSIKCHNFYSKENVIKMWENIYQNSYFESKKLKAKESLNL